MLSAGGATVKVREIEAVCAGLPLSVTRTVKLDVPLAVGVPEITPPLESVSPAGSVPDASVQAYGDVPPPAASVAV